MDGTRFRARTLWRFRLRRQVFTVHDFLVSKLPGNLYDFQEERPRRAKVSTSIYTSVIFHGFYGGKDQTGVHTREISFSPCTFVGISPLKFMEITGVHTLEVMVHAHLSAEKLWCTNCTMDVRCVASLTSRVLIENGHEGPRGVFGRFWPFYSLNVVEITEVHALKVMVRTHFPSKIWWCVCTCLYHEFQKCASVTSKTCHRKRSRRATLVGKKIVVYGAMNFRSVLPSLPGLS